MNKRIKHNAPKITPTLLSHVKLTKKGPFGAKNIRSIINIPDPIQPDSRIALLTIFSIIFINSSNYFGHNLNTLIISVNPA